MFVEVLIGWITLCVLSYIFAIFGMDRFYGEFKQDLSRIGKKIKNPQHCSICKGNLTTWLNQCVSCSICDKRTCRSCANYNLMSGEWICQSGLHRNSSNQKNSANGVNRNSSKFWHDDGSKGNKTLVERTVPLNTLVDRHTSTRYRELERVISDYLSITTQDLNLTDIGKIYKSSQYDFIFARYHEAISLEIKENLLPYLKANDGTREAIALRKLKDLLGKVRMASKMELNSLELNTSNRVCQDETFATTYPDILSTAIINRIIIDGQTQLSRNRSSPVSSDSAVLVDILSSDSTTAELPESGSDNETQSWVQSSASVDNSSGQRLTWDGEIMTDVRRSENMASLWAMENSVPHQIQIEESVEEITTTYNTDSSSAHGSRSSTDIEDDDSMDTEEPESLNTIEQDVTDWEQNWLFKRKLDLLKLRQNIYAPVTMVVPNPTEGVQIFVGDENIEHLDDDLDDLDMISLGYIVVDAEANEVVMSHHHGTNDNPFLVHENLPTILPSKLEDITNFVDIQDKGTTTADITIQIDKETFTQISLEHLQHQHEDNTSNQQKAPNVTIESTPLDNSEKSSTDGSTDSEPQIARFSIAQRETEKWNHPVPLKHNPYDAENLSRRLLENKTTMLQTTNKSLEEEGNTDKKNPDDFSGDQKNIDRFRRDYYVNSSESKDRKTSTSSSSSDDSDGKKIQQDHIHKIVPSIQKTEPIAHSDILEVDEKLEDAIYLPSVRNLAKRFSSPPPEDKISPMKRNAWKLPPPGTTTSVKQQIHSLTARSVSREFREGLRLSKPAITNHNIKINDNTF